MADKSHINLSHVAHVAVLGVGGVGVVVVVVVVVFWIVEWAHRPRASSYNQLRP